MQERVNTMPFVKLDIDKEVNKRIGSDKKLRYYYEQACKQYGQNNIIKEMRCRGKSIETGKWIYGYYAYVCGRHQIAYENPDGFYCEEEVMPYTIGRYTGLQDRNKNDIYEKDKCRNQNGAEFVVKFKNGCFFPSFDDINEKYCQCICLKDICEIEVIGYAYDI